MEKILKEIGEEYKEKFSPVLLGSRTDFIKAMNPTRIAALFIPFLNTILGAKTIFDIAKPAYRKIVPSVIEIALLRLSENIQREN
jgi:hypothetical protein